MHFVGHTGLCTKPNCACSDQNLLILYYLSRMTLQETKKEVEDSGGEAIVLVVDVSDREAVKKAVQETRFWCWS